MADGANSPERLIHLSGLERRLARKGIEISVREHIRLATLIKRLQDTGVQIRTPNEAAGWITPLLARNRETTEQVRNAVKDWWAEETPVSAMEEAASQFNEAVKNPVYRRFAISALMTVIAAIIALLFIGQITEEPPIEAPTGVATADDPATPLDLLDNEDSAPDPATVEDEKVAVASALGDRTLAEIAVEIVFPSILVLLPFGAAIWFLLRAPQQKFIQRGVAARVERDEIVLRPLETSVFVDSQSRMAFRRLAAPDIIPTRKLDLPRSIRASIADPTGAGLVFRSRNRSRSYVLIVEASSGEDHIHLVADALLEQARFAGLSIPRYELRNHLSFLRYIDGGRFDAKSDTLGAIARRHMGARLLILGSGEGLFDAKGRLLDHIDGAQPRGEAQTMFGYFEHPALMTTTPEAFMGDRERQLLAAGITLVPMTAEGLDDLAQAMTTPPGEERERQTDLPVRSEPVLFDWFRRARLDLLSDIPPTESEIDELRLELRNYFHGTGDWPIFLALMLMPTAITAQLTLSLLHALEQEAYERRIVNYDAEGNLIEVHLPKAYSRLATLARLARLPWFQVGYAPDWLRDAVITHSASDEVSLMRNVLQRLIEDEGYLPRSEGEVNAALEEDDWVLDLYREKARGARMATDRELPLIRALRGEDITQLAQPLPLKPRPHWRNILAASAAAVAGLGTLIWITPGAVLEVLEAGSNALSGSLGLSIAFFAMFFLSLSLIVLFLIDSFVQAEDRNRNWLARLFSPSRALIAFARGEAQSFSEFNSGGDEFFGTSGMNVAHGWLVERWNIVNPRLFRGWLPNTRVAEQPGPRMKGIEIAPGASFDKLIDTWQERADWADRRLARFGVILESIMFLACFASAWILLDGEHELFLFLALWMTTLVAARLPRWRGWTTFVLTPWRSTKTELDDTWRSNWFWLARLVPLAMILAQAAYLKATVDPSSTSPEIFYVWAAVSLGMLLVLEMARADTARTDFHANEVIQHALISLGLSGFVLVMFFEMNVTLGLLWIPGLLMLVLGHGLRLAGLFLMVTPILDPLVFSNAVRDALETFLPIAQETYLLTYAVGMLAFIGTILLLVRRRPSVRFTRDLEIADVG